MRSPAESRWRGCYLTAWGWAPHQRFPLAQGLPSSGTPETTPACWPRRRRRGAARRHHCARHPRRARLRSRRDDEPGRLADAGATHPHRAPRMTENQYLNAAFADLYGHRGCAPERSDGHRLPPGPPWRRATRLRRRLPHPVQDGPASADPDDAVPPNNKARRLINRQRPTRGSAQRVGLATNTTAVPRAQHSCCFAQL